VLLAALFVRLLWKHAPDLAASVGHLSGSTQVLAVMATEFGWTAALLGLFVAGLDFLSVRGAWFRRLKMTKAEVKRELREAEGDPELKAERRRAHQTLAGAQSIWAVEHATLLLQGSDKSVVALRYVDDEIEVPLIVARGRGNLAEQMRSVAHARAIPIHVAPELERTLREYEIGTAIPATCFDEVAEFLRD
jgi:flagellar biosynthetic protein FlhB